jgi:hypothetical protein
MAPQLGEGVPEFRYREVLACASAVSFVSILLPIWVWLPKDLGRQLGLIAFLPFYLPYAFIPLRLYGQRLRSGLTLAITMGCALVVPGVYLVRFAITWDRRWLVLGNLTVALLMQLVLIIVGVKAYIRLPRLPRTGLRVLAGPAYGFTLFTLFLCFYSPVPRYITANEGWAMRYLSAAATSAFLDDLQKHSNSYPMAIAGWAPVPNPRCAMDDPWVIPPGNPADGYFFEYTGNPPSTTVEGCTRFQSFTMTARPVVFGRTGIRSFFVDKSGEIHATSENRAANASDPVDDTLLRTHRPQ